MLETFIKKMSNCHNNHNSDIGRFIPFFGVSTADYSNIVLKTNKAIMVSMKPVKIVNYCTVHSQCNSYMFLKID